MASQPSEKILASQLDLHRIQMASQLAVLRENLDVPRKVKGSLAKHPGIWCAGAAVLGLALAQIPRAKKGSNHERVHDVISGQQFVAKQKSKPFTHALFLMAVKAAADYAKPAAMAWMKQYLAAYAQQQPQAPAPQRPQTYTPYTESATTAAPV